MHAVVSLLASSLVVASLAFNYQAMVNQFSHLLLSSSRSEQLLSAKPKPKSNQSAQPEHRGSGRRELMKYYKNTHFTV